MTGIIQPRLEPDISGLRVGILPVGTTLSCILHSMKRIEYNISMINAWNNFLPDSYRDKLFVCLCVCVCVCACACVLVCTCVRVCL